MGSKIKTSDKKRGNPKMQDVKKQRPSMKKYNPKMQGAQKQRPPMKSEANLKRNGLKNKKNC
jgi:tRNA U55 pseudouridine synthase TruB